MLGGLGQQRVEPRWPAAPQFLGSAPSPRPGLGCPASARPAGSELLVPQACRDSPAALLGPGWGAAWWGHPVLPQPSHPVVSTPRFTGPAARCPRWLRCLHTAGCPVHPGCSALPGAFEPHPVLCPQAQDCRPLGSSTPPPGVQEGVPSVLEALEMAPGVALVPSPGSHPGPLPGITVAPSPGHPGPLPGGHPGPPPPGVCGPPPGRIHLGFCTAHPPLSVCAVCLPGPQRKGPRLGQFCLP